MQAFKEGIDVVYLFRHFKPALVRRCNNTRCFYIYQCVPLAGIRIVQIHAHHQAIKDFCKIIKKNDWNITVRGFVLAKSALFASEMTNND